MCRCWTVIIKVADATPPANDAKRSRAGKGKHRNTGLGKRPLGLGG
jgi:hypothetical protein